MKLFAIFAVGLVAATSLGPVPAANAQRVVVRERHHVVVRHDRRKNYRRPALRQARYRTVCRTRWNNGRRVRRCVQVRR